MRPDYVLGIDPGLSGAAALLRVSDKSLIHVADMPVAKGRVDPVKLAGLVEMYKTYGSIAAAVELVGSMPRQSGAFNFGVSAGVVHGVLGALGVPCTLVSPSQWKPAMGLRKMLNESRAQNKGRARELAVKLWPGQAELFARVKDDGRAEAALLARHAIDMKGW